MKRHSSCGGKRVNAAITGYVTTGLHFDLRGLLQVNVGVDVNSGNAAKPAGFRFCSGRSLRHQSMLKFPADLAIHTWCVLNMQFYLRLCSAKNSIGFRLWRNFAAALIGRSRWPKPSPAIFPTAMSFSTQKHPTKTLHRMISICKLRLNRAKLCWGGEIRHFVPDINAQSLLHSTRGLPAGTRGSGRG